MFITNIEKIGVSHPMFYICDAYTSELLIRNGFPLLSAIFKEDKFVFSKTDKLVNFLKNGGE